MSCVLEKWVERGGGGRRRRERNRKGGGVGGREQHFVLGHDSAFVSVFVVVFWLFVYVAVRRF